MWTTGYRGKDGRSEAMLEAGRGIQIGLRVLVSSYPLPLWGLGKWGNSGPWTLCHKDKGRNKSDVRVCLTRADVFSLV